MKNLINIITLCLFAITAQAEVMKSKIYYFHGTARCISCKKIESYTQEVFNENFQKQLNFEVINVEKPENRHFINDYGLYTKAVILSKVKDGKEVEHKNLDKIWRLLNNKNAFKKYIRSQTQQFLITNKG